MSDSSMPPHSSREEKAGEVIFQLRFMGGTSPLHPHFTSPSYWNEQTVLRRCGREHSGRGIILSLSVTANKSVFLMHRNTHSQTDMTTGDLTFSTTLRDNVSIIQTKRAVSLNLFKNRSGAVTLSLFLLFVWHGEMKSHASPRLSTHIYLQNTLIKITHAYLNIMESLSWMREA